MPLRENLIHTPVRARDPHGLILDDARVVSVYDVGTYLEARELPGVLLQGDDDTRSVQDELLDNWEESKPRNVFDVNLDEVTTVTTVYVDNNGTYEGYKIYRGEIDIVDVRAQMEGGNSKGNSRGSLPGLPVVAAQVGTHYHCPLRGGRGIRGGAGRTGQGRRQGNGQGRGVLDAQSALGIVLEAAGTGLWTVAFTDCEASHYHVPYVILKDFEDGLPLLTSYPSLLQGCVANATTVTGGDEDLSKVTMAVEFSSERRAERGLEDLKGRLADFDRLDIDVDDAQIKGDLAVVELAIYE